MRLYASARCSRLDDGQSKSDSRHKAREYSRHFKGRGWGRMRNKIGILIPLLFASQPLTSAIAGKEVTYYLTDNQGTPLATTDAQGNVTGLFEITPYGVARLDPPGTIGFGGHVVDDAVTAIYMQSRYYDPSTGRFLSTDPAGIAVGNISSIDGTIMVSEIRLDSPIQQVRMLSRTRETHRCCRRLS